MYIFPKTCNMAYIHIYNYFTTFLAYWFLYAIVLTELDLH